MTDDWTAWDDNPDDSDTAETADLSQGYDDPTAPDALGGVDPGLDPSLGGTEPDGPELGGHGGLGGLDGMAGLAGDDLDTAYPAVGDPFAADALVSDEASDDWAAALEGGPDSDGTDRSGGGDGVADSGGDASGDSIGTAASDGIHAATHGDVPDLDDPSASSADPAEVDDPPASAPDPAEVDDPAASGPDPAGGGDAADASGAEDPAADDAAVGDPVGAGLVGADPDVDPHADGDGWPGHEFPAPLDLGPAPEPVDGFPWTDPQTLGVPDALGGPDSVTDAQALTEALLHGDTPAVPVQASDLADYAGLAADATWESLANSEDPATAALARFWTPEAP